jgi:hypothetical protein
MSPIPDTNDWPADLGPRQLAFLEAFSLLGNVWKAAEGVCQRTTHYKWLKDSEPYRQAFDIARQLFGERLRQIAIERAVDGIEEPVIRKGGVLKDGDGKVVTRKRYDRALLKALMQWATRPWDLQLQSYLSDSKATQSDTSGRPISKVGAPKPGGLPGEPVRIGKRIGYAID